MAAVMAAAAGASWTSGGAAEAGVDLPGALNAPLPCGAASSAAPDDRIATTIPRKEPAWPSSRAVRTEQNLLKAFAGESQARNRYTFYAKIAKKEGYEQIAAIFIETAMNEEQHAKIFFKYLEGGVVEITATYPAGSLNGTTAENLLGRRRTARTRSGPTCTRPSPTSPTLRASPRSPGASARSPRSRRTTRSATASCWPTSTTTRSSRRKRRSPGSAASAASCTRGPRRSPSARPATTRWPTRKCTRPTTESPNPAGRGAAPGPAVKEGDGAGGRSHPPRRRVRAPRGL